MMLVPGKTSYQSVIKVTVLFNKPGQVVLGTDTPDGVESRREEVFPQFQQTESSQNISI